MNIEHIIIASQGLHGAMIHEVKVNALLFTLNDYISTLICLHISANEGTPGYKQF